jgi:hypothetical protein
MARCEVPASVEPPESPEVAANWLPAPNTDFSLYLWAYWAAETMINGSWSPPPVGRIDCRGSAYSAARRVCSFSRMPCDLGL